MSKKQGSFEKLYLKSFSLISSPMHLNSMITLLKSNRFYRINSSLNNGHDLEVELLRNGTSQLATVIEV